MFIQLSRVDHVLLLMKFQLDWMNSMVFYYRILCIIIHFISFISIHYHNCITLYLLLYFGISSGCLQERRFCAQVSEEANGPTLPALS